MRKKLTVKIVATLMLSVMLLGLPIGALLSNDSVATTVQAEDGIAADTDIVSDDTGGGEENAGSGETGEENGGNTEENDGSESGNEVTPTPEPTSDPIPDPEPECICDHRCTRSDFNHDCPVCSADYEDCGYEEPNVKITIEPQSGWYPSGASVKVKFTARDILDTGNFEIKSVMAKIGQNGVYHDVTEDMFLEISENCTVYVLVTDARDKSYERSRAITCFDTSKPTLNAAVTEGLLTVRAVDNESGVRVIYVNGYEFSELTNGTVNIRLSQFDAGYQYFTITAMDNAGNVSEVYKTKNPYYKDPESDDSSEPAQQLPVSAEATKPSQATAVVTQHTQTDPAGNTVSQTPSPVHQEVSSSPSRTDTEEESDTTVSTSTDLDLGKEFYTIQAASGKVFYLIVDRDGQNEMVYFLTEITENDLLNVTTNNSQTLPKNSAALESQITVTESALPNNNTDYEETHEVKAPTVLSEEAEQDGGSEQGEDSSGEETDKPVKKNSMVGYIIMGVIGAAAIGCGYYFKVVKKKQDGDFVEDEDEDADEEVYPDDAEEENTSDDAFLDNDPDEN